MVWYSFPFSFAFWYTLFGSGGGRIERVFRFRAVNILLYWSKRLGIQVIAGYVVGSSNCLLVVADQYYISKNKLTSFRKLITRDVVSALLPSASRILSGILLFALASLYCGHTVKTCSTLFRIWQIGH